MEQTVCRMHTEPSWVFSVRFPLFPCLPMSKAQRQRKGLHWALLQTPSCNVNTQGQNINKPKQGKKNKQGRRKERKCNIFRMRKHQPWALPAFRAERGKGLTLVTQRNNDECYLPNKEVGFVTCDLSLMHRGRQQLVPPPQGKRKLQLSKPVSCLLPSHTDGSLHCIPRLVQSRGFSVRLGPILPAAPLPRHLFQAPFSRTQPPGGCFQLPLQQSVL